MRGGSLNTISFNTVTKDGASLRTEFTSSESVPIKGVVIVVHGFGEHLGGYKEVTSKLSASGYATMIYDQRGHGELLSQGEPTDQDRVKSSEKLKKLQGIIPSYQAFLDDIDIMILKAKELTPDVPIALYGHSMGGNIVLNYLLKQTPNDVRCIVLESPWLGLYKELSPIMDRLAKIIGSLSKNIAIINKLEPEVITGDASKNREYDDDPLYHNRISLRMYSGVKKGCAYALQNASKLAIPIFLANGKFDQVVSNNAIHEFAKAAGECLYTKEYDAYHAIRKGFKSEVFFQDVIEFLSNNIS